jgi:Lipase maturation factor
MWFAALSPRYAEPWFQTLVQRLLEGDRRLCRLLLRNPFPDAPPGWVRAHVYRYRFSTRAERADSGCWWVREPVGQFVGPTSRRAPRAR